MNKYDKTIWKYKETEVSSKNMNKIEDQLTILTDEAINTNSQLTDGSLKGDPGAVGPIGPKGDSGIPGAVGPTGPKGDKGDSGIQGAVGPIGPKGDKGDKGDSGIQGAVGPIGPKGDKGDKGDSGIPGAVGPIGPKGDKGDSGIQGAVGPIGPKGDKGDKGDPGAVGPTGPKGDSGVVGAGTTTLDKYSGDNTNDKMKAMIKDITNNKLNDVMLITLPDGVIEITEDMVIDGWTNKTISCPGVLHFKNCNGIVFKRMQHCNVHIHRYSSIVPATGTDNPQGFISISAVNSLTKNGIKISDCSYSDFTFNQCLGFATGLWLYSEYGAMGTFYNNITLPNAWRCKLGLLLNAGKAADDTGTSMAGWVNDNRFYSGMFDVNNAIQIGQPLANRPKGEPMDSYHNNKFYDTGFEQIRDVNPIAIDMQQGVSNSFTNPRFEKSMTDTGYVFVKEGKDAVMNVYTTSNYMININRIFLNTSSVKDDGKNQGKQHSMFTACFIKEGTGVLANKMTATKGKVVYEAYGVENYYLTEYCPNNLINYTFADTEFAKFKNSTGVIKTIKYTS